MSTGLAEMLRYNRWANQQLFRACRDVGGEQLDSRPPGISGSIRELLVHIVGGQQTFVLRTKPAAEGELSAKALGRVGNRYLP